MYLRKRAMKILEKVGTDSDDNQLKSSETSHMEKV